MKLITSPPYSLCYYRTGIDSWVWCVSLLDPVTQEPASVVGRGESNCETAARNAAEMVLQSVVQVFWELPDGSKVPVPPRPDDLSFAAYLERWQQFCYEAAESQRFNLFVAQSYAEWLEARRAQSAPGEVAAIVDKPLMEGS